MEVGLWDSRDGGHKVYPMPQRLTVQKSPPNHGSHINWQQVEEHIKSHLSRQEWPQSKRATREQRAASTTYCRYSAAVT